MDSFQVAKELCENIFDFALRKKLSLKEGLRLEMKNCVPIVWKELGASNLFESYMEKGYARLQVSFIEKLFINLTTEYFEFTDESFLEGDLVHNNHEREL